MDIFATTITTSTLIIQFLGACSEFSTDAKSLKARFDWDLRALKQVHDMFENLQTSDGNQLLSPEDAALLERTSEYLGSLVSKVHKSFRKIDRKGWLRGPANRSLWITRRSQIQELEREIYEWTERLNLRVLSLPEGIRTAIPTSHIRNDAIRSSIVLRNGDRLQKFLALSSDDKLTRAKAMLLETPKQLTSRIRSSDDLSTLPFQYNGEQLILSSRQVSDKIAPATPAFNTLSTEMAELAGALNCLEQAMDIMLLKVKYYLFHPESNQFLFAHIPPYKINSMMTLQQRIIHDPFPKAEGPLNDCLKIAYKLAESVFFLHTAGFLHKNITPQSVIILWRSSREPGEAYLMGFNLIRGAESATYQEGTSRQNDQAPRYIWDFDIFQHPDRLRGPNSPRYIKTYDIYSLGVVLLELGFWQPLPQVVGHLNQEDPSSWPQELSRAASNITRRVGKRYQRMVEWCLNLSGNRIVRPSEYMQEVLDPLEDMMNALA